MRGSNCGGGQEFSHPFRPDRLYSPPGLLFNWHRSFVLGVERLYTAQRNTFPTEVAQKSETLILCNIQFYRKSHMLHINEETEENILRWARHDSVKATLRACRVHPLHRMNCYQQQWHNMCSEKIAKVTKARPSGSTQKNDFLINIGISLQVM